MQNTGTLKLTMPGDREIVITRVFEAPQTLVWEALTRPELLKRWFFGPPGWSLDVCEVDLRVGGAYRHVWRGPDGVKMGVGGVHCEIVAPERIVATELFEEAWYPGEALVTYALAEQNGRTTLTLTVRCESPEACDAVLKTPMEHGLAMQYDRLADMLAALPAHQSIPATT